MEPSSSVQSVDRAFALLQLLAGRASGMQLSELSKATGLHKSTVHRLLTSLMALGYVKKMPGQNGRYTLTMKLFELAAPLVDGTDLLSVARPYLERLCDDVGETVHLVVRDGNEIVYIFKAESTNNAYRMVSRLGMRREMYCTAAGKSILAALPGAQAHTSFQESSRKAYTPHTITSWPRLQAELKATQTRGYAIDNEENELGVRCIAAALTDYTGYVPAAFSISAPITRLPDERLPLLAEQVTNTRRQISAELGHKENR